MKPTNHKFDLSALPASVTLSDLSPYIALIHCTKTGQPIATMLPSEQVKLLRLHNVSNVSDLLSTGLCLASGISRAWVQTNPETLDTLQRIDPHGFFVFCLGRFLEHDYRTTDAKGRKLWISVEWQNTFYNSLCMAWHAIADIPGNALEDANRALRAALYMNLHIVRAYRIDWRAIAEVCKLPTSQYGQHAQGNNYAILPHHLAQRACIDIIAASLHRATKAIASRKVAWDKWQTAAAYKPAFMRPQTSIELLFNNMLSELPGFEHKLSYLEAEPRRIAVSITKSNPRPVQQSIAKKSQPVNAADISFQAPKFTPCPATQEQPTSTTAPADKNKMSLLQLIQLGRAAK